ncbi:MAG TPA: endonuclease/exonuclease/phosphatase family protein [Phycisphaerales bacterium]|nr:endonuclease/exonuclease/phosphatase family protein [Phycisphaerales bacterium]
MALQRTVQIVLGAAAVATVAAAALFTQPGMEEQPVAPAAPRQGEKQAETKPKDTVRFGVRKAPAKTPGAVRVTTFNVENLFDDKDDPKLSGTFEDKGTTKPAEQMKAAADAIRQLDCDILCLQEVESEEAVKWFRDGWLKGMGYDYVASVDAGDPRGIEQAVLSRFPIKNVRTYNRQKLGGRQPDKWGRENNSEAGSPFEFKRSPLQVTVEIPSSSVVDLLRKAGKTDARAGAYELTLFVVHLKSGRDYDAQRHAEAKGVAALVATIEKEKPGANVLVLGDCNATLNQNALKPFEDAKMRTIFSDRNPQDPVTMTHTTRRCIDHIYYNANIKPELLLSTRFVLGMPARDEKADWRTTPPPPGYASDHYPVSVDLTPVEAK